MKDSLLTSEHPFVVMWFGEKCLQSDSFKPIIPQNASKKWQIVTDWLIKINIYNAYFQHVKQKSDRWRIYSNKNLKCKSSDEKTLALQGLIRHHKNAPETEHSRGIRLVNEFIYFFLKKWKTTSRRCSTTRGRFQDPSHNSGNQDIWPWGSDARRATRNCLEPKSY